MADLEEVAGSGFTSLLKMTMSSLQVLQSALLLNCALPPTSLAMRSCLAIVSEGCLPDVRYHILFCRILWICRKTFHLQKAASTSMQLLLTWKPFRRYACIAQ